MVPVYSLEATSSTFVGHAWGAFRALHVAAASHAQILRIARPALLAALIALAVEVPLCLVMTFKAAYPFALYLSQSPAVARITASMWRSIDWCYIIYGVSTQLASLLLATRPRWFFAQSLITNVLWVLPWAVVVQAHGLRSGDPWRWHAIVFGGSMVVSGFVVSGVVMTWAWTLRRGKRGKRGVRVEGSS